MRLDGEADVNEADDDHGEGRGANEEGAVVDLADHAASLLHEAAARASALRALPHSFQ